MYLLDERLRRFFSPIVIIALMSEILFFFSEKGDLYSLVSYYAGGLLVVYSSIIIFLIYVAYPLIKILLKKYGTIIQRIIALLILISSFLAVFFSFVGTIYTLLWILYLAIFLNFSSTIEKNGERYYILSYPIKKNSSDFDEIINSSSFNVLVSIVFLTIVAGESLFYFDPYFALISILAIVLVMSSVIYGKSDKSIDY